jgi:ketosteroid isomerase-like protein
MSQENVEIVRAAIAAWNAGDMDAVRELYHPDAIVRSPDGWPEPGPFVGRDAVMREWEQLRQTFDDDALELLGDFRAAGDRVAVRFVWHGAGRGPEAGLEMTQVNTVRRGQIFAIEYFWNHSEALEALGLSEQDAHAGS